MFFARIFFILISLFLITSFEVSFAASGSLSTWSGIAPIAIRDIEKIDKEKNKDTETNSGTETSTEEEKIEEQKTEKNAQKIILEVYKIQGNKILKDMDISIEKVNPDPKIRIDIYSSIQKTLELRKIKVEKWEMSKDSKDILTGYINYMVYAIEKKKKNLE
jgi:hypothetical protein